MATSSIPRRCLGCFGLLGSTLSEPLTLLFSGLRAKGVLGPSSRRMSISPDFQ